MSNKLTAVKNIGKLIIALASIASLNPYLLIFTIPAFVLGAIFIWISNLKTNVKAFWTILPVLLWYPSFLLFMFLSGIIGTATSQKLDFIFPINFEGKAIVIENMPCGQPVKVLNGREQLFVPESGVLLYQGELKGGYINHKYYRIYSNGRTIELPQRASRMYFEDEMQKPDTKVLGAWFLGSGNSTNEKGKYYSFMDILVSSKDSADKFYEFYHTQKLEALGDSLVNQCR